MTRIDMGEYMEQHAVARLIGSPPGYVGYEQGGQLTEAVRRRPYSIVLFDEIEKAHPDVFNVLLQVLDDGRLTDGQGRTVNFKNTIIIMTSNIGSSAAGVRDTSKLDEVLRRHFKPEFINRIDDIVVFQPIDAAAMQHITRVQLEKITKDIAANKHIQLQFDDGAIDWLATTGFDEQYGARPLKRLIQREVLNPLAKRIIEGAIKEDSIVTVGVEAGKIQLR